MTLKKSDKKQKTKNKRFKNDFNKHFIINFIIIFLIISIIVYFLVYLCFFSHGFISVGVDLEKRDWLSFFGSFIGFVGSVFVGSIALLLNHHYQKMDATKRKQKRFERIQPYFAVEILGYNVQLPNTAEMPFTRHDNIQLRISNLNSFPIRNLQVIESYYIPYLKSNESIDIYFTQNGSVDSKIKNKYLIVADKEYFKNGKLDNFNINYEDVDGNECFQVFKYVNNGEISYYRISGPCENI